MAVTLRLRLVAGFALNIVRARAQAAASFRPATARRDGALSSTGPGRGEAERTLRRLRLQRAQLSASTLLPASFMRDAPQPTLHVTIVAVNAETLDGLQGYLSLAGLDAHGTRRLDGLGRKPCSAVIFFPDEFSPTTVLRELVRLRREHPTVLPLLVTSEPQRYRGMPATS